MVIGSGALGYGLQLLSGHETILVTVYDSPENKGMIA
jgi:hypothetical protein